MIDFCRKEKTNIVPIKKIQQYGPSGLRAKPAIEAALEELEGLDRARFVQEGKRKTIHVNPKLLESAK